MQSHNFSSLQVCELGPALVKKVVKTFPTLWFYCKVVGQVKEERRGKKRKEEGRREEAANRETADHERH